MVASRGATISGLPLIGQSIRSPPLALTASRRPALRSTSMVLISMWTVPGLRVRRVPAGPAMISSTSAAVGTIDISTSVRAATSAGEAATAGAAGGGELG